MTQRSFSRCILEGGRKLGPSELQRRGTTTEKVNTSQLSVARGIQGNPSPDELHSQADVRGEPSPSGMLAPRNPLAASAAQFAQGCCCHRIFVIGTATLHPLHALACTSVHITPHLYHIAIMDWTEFCPSPVLVWKQGIHRGKKWMLAREDPMGPFWDTKIVFLSKAQNNRGWKHTVMYEMVPRMHCTSILYGWFHTTDLIQHGAGINPGG